MKSHLRKCSVCEKLFVYRWKKTYSTNEDAFICSDECAERHKQDASIVDTAELPDTYSTARHNIPVSEKQSWRIYKRMQWKRKRA